MANTITAKEMDTFQDELMAMAMKARKYAEKLEEERSLYSEASALKMHKYADLLLDAFEVMEPQSITQGRTGKGYNTSSSFITI